MPRRRCRKRTYFSELRAMIALIEVQKRRGTGKTERSVYRCPHCRNWHLTSQPQRARP